MANRFSTKLLGVGFGICLSVFMMAPLATPISAQTTTPWWDIQSIDTMKYSRDLSRELLTNPARLSSITNQQVQLIAATGATHVAIATPYDEEFVPVLAAWVKAARSAGLHVWFRGNLSGWEGWFEYPRLSRTEHTKQVVAFIATHPELFADGDLFSSCPECENGGPGDPRLNGDAAGHQKFLISESKAVTAAFKAQHRQIITDLHSMNGDVAKLVMDPKTTRELGGILTVDHYVATPTELADDIQAYAERAQARVMLGEFGAPIPDLQGDMTPAEQAKWIDESLLKLSGVHNLMGVNYWVNMGGSTALWDESGRPTPAVAVLTKYFKPATISGRVLTTTRRAVPKATLTSLDKTVTSDENGTFVLPYIAQTGNVVVTASGYQDLIIPFNTLADGQSIILTSLAPQSWWERLVSWFLAKLP